MPVSGPLNHRYPRQSRGRLCLLLRQRLTSGIRRSSTSPQGFRDDVEAKCDGDNYGAAATPLNPADPSATGWPAAVTT